MNLFNWLGNNWLGSTKANTWNVLPAFLSTYANILSFNGNKSTYELYKEQARNYVDAAQEEAELIEKQGKIALRNLVIKNKLEAGSDIATVAGRGGNMSGSNLDVVMQKEKIRLMDEAAVKANYTLQASVAKRNGYRQAASTYGTLAAKAAADKWNVWSSVLKGVGMYVGLSTRDALAESANDTAKAVQDANFEAFKNYFNIPKDSGLLSSTAKTPSVSNGWNEQLSVTTPGNLSLFYSDGSIQSGSDSSYTIKWAGN